jgi:hypothetical protein
MALRTSITLSTEMERQVEYLQREWGETLIGVLSRSVDHDYSRATWRTRVRAELMARARQNQDNGIDPVKQLGEVLRAVIGDDLEAWERLVNEPY